MGPVRRAYRAVRDLPGGRARSARLACVACVDRALFRCAAEVLQGVGRWYRIQRRVRLGYRTRFWLSVQPAAATLDWPAIDPGQDHDG